MEHPSSVVLTLTHPLVARAEHTEAEALLAECCPHGAVPGLVRGGVVALFLPAPRSTLRVFVALVGRGAGQRLAPLRGPLHSTFSGRGTRSEVAHVVEGCDTVATTRRVLHATRHLHRVQPRGDVPGLHVLGADDGSRDDDGSSEDTAADLPFDECDDPPFGCPKDLDLSELSDHGTGSPSVAVTPRVLRLPQGYPLRMTCGSSFFMSPIRRIVFHPDTLYTTIGSSGMCYANNLTILDFRGLKQLFSFGTHALQFCKRLTAVCMRGLPKLERLDQGTFAHCPKLSMADCRDCFLLRESSAGAFTGNARDLCVLIGDEQQRQMIRESTAEHDRAHVIVLTSAELAHRRAESGNATLHRCPVCEGDDDRFDATLYDSDSEND